MNESKYYKVFLHQINMRATQKKTFVLSNNMTLRRSALLLRK